MIICCCSEGSVRIDFNLEHTYYLDQSYPGHEALRRILMSELRRGRLGIYSASTENFVFERIDLVAEGNVVLVTRQIYILLVLCCCHTHVVTVAK